MAKSFKDVVQDSPRTGLGIPVKTKNPLSRTTGKIVDIGSTQVLIGCWRVKHNIHKRLMFGPVS